MTRLEAMFDNVKCDALDYIGLYQAPVSAIGSVLATAVAKKGIGIFSDAAALRQAMTDTGASEADICRVQLMAQVSGFQELLDQGQRVMQADLDRYVYNAAAETGFNRDVVLELTSGIVFAIGGEMNNAKPSMQETQYVPRTVAALASSLYEEPLHTFQKNFEQKMNHGASVMLDFESLEPLVEIGIPQAKYYMGICLLNGIQLDVNEERGVELLQEAAGMGSGKAAAALGDYYYALGGSDNWTKAYQYYTGFGADALNKSRRSAATNILNQEIFNRKLLGLCVILLLVFAATVIWPPAAAVYAHHPVTGWLMMVLQLGLVVLGFLHHRARPYDFIYGLPVAMSGLWFLYMAVRLLF